MKTQNLLSFGLIVLGLALIFYFSRIGIFRAMVHGPDLFVVIAVMIAVNLVFAISLTPRVRTYINQHGKRISKIGIAMLLLFLLSPFVFLCILITLNMTVNLPDHYFDAILWTDFSLAFVGMMVAMIPAHVKFFEYLRSMKRQ